MAGLNKKCKLFAKHFVGELETFEALELCKVLFSLHSGRVSEDSIEHFFLGHLKAVLVRNLLLVARSAREAFQIFSNALVVLPQEFEELKLLPKLFLLA